VQTVEGASQRIFIGPVASLVSIMQIGTNGGGYYGANSTHPFMNPNPVSNVFEIFLMMLMSTTMCFVYGEILGDRKESRPIVWGSFGLLAIDLAIAFIPDQVLGPGMEVRFGGFFSTLWTVITTATMTGSLNAWLSAMHPLAILSGFLGMLFQSSPGGKGMGTVYMAMYVIITVFIVGLMSGRTPEYLGMKINARDVKLVMGAFLIHPLIILIPTLLAYASGAVTEIGLSGDSIGFTQILYEYTTAAANNGSDFLGASANTLFFNISTGIVMAVGRYGPMGLLLALSGSMVGRRRGAGTGLRTDSVTFSLILIASTLVLVALTFFPFLALGPILSLLQGRLNGL
jgi:K+-transporting ATPase ATPase A chain